MRLALDDRRTAIFIFLGQAPHVTESANQHQDPYRLVVLTESPLLSPFYAKNCGFAEFFRIYGLDSYLLDLFKPDWEHQIME